ncbi:MAG TPA: helicase C-terminal domain-containing protein, partial [Anaerolineae bacterium]|nr:helicase C-terminal domain-containing protein [Anaerolineae bacterium]
ERSLAALIAATGGRTLALFTSYNQLRRTARAIGPRLADAGITLLEQGSGGSRAQLLESFRTLDKAALLGTRSFWEGIDVMGPALSCLVIARLPFSVPTDPVYAARSASFDEPFYQYAVPETILRFRQAFGRLIRSKSDRGVVVVLDRRVQSKAYGQLFLDSLPECTTRRAPLAQLPPAAAQWIQRQV